jgi:integrase
MKRKRFSVEQVVGVLTGMRPEECHCLRWENINWDGGRNGVLLITRGQTKSARRVLPLSPRVRAVLENRWKVAGEPGEGWVWPAENEGRSYQSRQLEAPAPEGLEASQDSPFRGLLDPAHFPHQTGRKRL